MKTIQIFACLFLTVSVLFLAASDAQAQSPDKTVFQMLTEVNNYISDKIKDLANQRKIIDGAQRMAMEIEKKSLATKYAEEAAARPNLKEFDLYYLGELYLAAENDAKALETMKRFLAQYPPETKWDMIQAARNYIIVLLARKRLPAEAEQTYQAWLKGAPATKSQQSVLELVLAIAFFQEKQYEPAIKYAQHAFDLLKTIEAKTYLEKGSKDQLYMDLVQILALSYRKNDNKEAAFEILAQALAQSFALPSVNLYRKVMNFAGDNGFPEKKLMQKIESYSTAKPAPELRIIDWLGQEPTLLKGLRGKVVLLDFWMTGCPDCIEAFPRLHSWHKKYGGNDFVIIGVTKYLGRANNKPLTRGEELEFLTEFKQMHKLPYQIAITDRNEDVMKYGIITYPTTVLLDRNGVIRYIELDAGMKGTENLEDMIKKLLKE